MEYSEYLSTWKKKKKLCYHTDEIMTANDIYIYTFEDKIAGILSGISLFHKQ